MPPRRLLFATPFAPRRDLRHGGRVIAQLLARLAERHRIGLVYLHAPGDEPLDPGIAARAEVVHAVEARGRGEARQRLVRRAATLASPLTARPSAVALLNDGRLGPLAARVASEWRPDVVQVEHDVIAYCGPALRAAGAPGARVLTCHEPGPPAAHDQLVRSRGRQRLAHRLDELAWRRYWARCLPAFEAVVTFTEGDAEAVRGARPDVLVEAIPLAIDVPEAPLSAAGAEEESVLFVGGYWHPPNAAAALRLERAIMPRVRQLVGREVPLRLVGTDPGEELWAAAGPADEVVGAVPEVEPYLDAASVLALPIATGGGMRVKLLEGLAAGKAVVATRLAAAGLEVQDGRELRLAESDEELAEAIADLLRDRGAREALGRRAREWAQANLGWEERVAAYESLYERVLRGRRD